MAVQLILVMLYSRGRSVNVRTPIWILLNSAATFLRLRSCRVISFSSQWTPMDNGQPMTLLHHQNLCYYRNSIDLASQSKLLYLVLRYQMSIQVSILSQEVTLGSFTQEITYNHAQKLLQHWSYKYISGGYGDIATPRTFGPHISHKTPSYRIVAYHSYGLYYYNYIVVILKTSCSIRPSAVHVVKGWSLPCTL